MKWHVAVDKRLVEVDLAALPDLSEVQPGVYSALHEGRSYELLITPVNGSWAVDVGGRRLVVDASDPRRAGPRHKRGQEGRLNLTAAMPGKVVRTLVNAGDEVAAGQGIVVVEAMKMQNELKAPRAGRIVAVLVRPGGTISAGEVLATME